MNIPHHRWNSWKKSSFSGQETDCVEAAPWGEVRDSKNPTGPTLKIGAENLRRFIVTVKSSN